MKRRALAVQLLSAGRTTALSTEGGRIRFWGIFLAAGLMMLGLSGLALAYATYEGRDMRGAARTPQILQQGSADKAVALWAWGNDDVAGRQHSVTYIEPLVQNAPLPPGLNKWPEPGEAVLSSALIRAGAPEGIESRYGKLAGTIGKEGLQAPEERFAYVRPRANLLDKHDMYPLKGFGVPAGSAAGVGESMSIPDFSVLAAGVAGFVLLPAGALLLVSARAGSTARERRLALFEALGASRGARGIFTLGEAAVPTILGAVVAACVLLPAFMLDIPFPLVDFTLSAEDVRRCAAWLVAAAATAILLVLAAAVLLHSKRRKSAREVRPTVGSQRLRASGPWMFPFALLFAVRGPELAGDDLRLPVYALGVVAVLATLPVVVGAFCGWLGIRLAAAGRRLGLPGLLIAGRRISAKPRGTARFVTALIVMIGLVAQVQLWTGLLGENATLAKQTQERIGSTLLSVSPYADADRVQDFAAAMPADTELLLVRQTPPNGESPGKITLSGTCAALRALDLPCKTSQFNAARSGLDPRVGELARWSLAGGDGVVTVARGPVEGAKAQGEESLSLVAVSKSGEALSLPRLREAARTHLAAGASADPLGQSWLLGSNDLAALATWVRLLGLIGAFLTVLAIGISALAEFLRFSREIAPLSVLTGGNGVNGSVVAWSLLFPALLASALGSTISMWLTTPITVDGGAPVPGDMYVLLGVGAGVCAVALCAWGWRSTNRAALRWRPAPD
ncbi:hypothetical protein [Streptomyces sp. NBC_00878]|uniref:hypothetical protein n=1 Tax=Streptomyces sp. NBC_00878 TaxID=2975854 RepID=UPI0022585FAB|nr:hypothetical protein [Streptomyces sp. NBC_00878]MCX4908874.1 hypothetical protein [Streptomyces sp. NBC_00878]